MKTRFRRLQGAFTLVELLVVITIVAVLMTLLQPSLLFTREVARTTACQSVLHGNGVAIACYANDNRTLVPPAGWYQTHPVQAGRQWYPWVFSRYDAITNKTYPKAGIGIALFPGYLTTYRSFYCASMLDDPTILASRRDQYWLPTPETSPYITGGGTTPQFLNIGYLYTGGWKTSGMANFSYPAYQCQASIDERDMILMQDFVSQNVTTLAWNVAHPRQRTSAAGGSFLFTDGRVKFGSSRGANIANANGWAGDLWAQNTSNAWAFAVR